MTKLRRKMRQYPIKPATIFCISFSMAFFMLTPPLLAEGCRTGADALGNVYVRSNYLYALIYGSVESYVENNRSHFGTNGDAVQCARQLSGALIGGALGAYNPNDLRRRQELNARLGAMGISPGQTPVSPAQALFAMGRQIGWLSRVLPSAAAGDYRPLHTPETQEQQMQMFAGQFLTNMIHQDPMIRNSIMRVEPYIREAAEAEYRLLLNYASRLAP